MENQSQGSGSSIHGQREEDVHFAEAMVNKIHDNMKELDPQSKDVCANLQERVGVLLEKLGGLRKSFPTRGKQVSLKRCLEAAFDVEDIVRERQRLQGKFPKKGDKRVSDARGKVDQCNDDFKDQGCKVEALDLGLWRRPTSCLDKFPYQDSDDQIAKFLAMARENRGTAVIGETGMGKTCLLRIVFNKLKPKYQIQVWLSASHCETIEQIQANIIKELGGDQDENESGGSLEGGLVRRQQLIFSKLTDKACIVALDNVCLTSKYLKDVKKKLGYTTILRKIGFPSDERCKVLISTREQEVPPLVGAEAYEINPLSHECSMKLFCYSAFPDFYDPANMNCEDIMSSTIQKIVEQCRGVPLAIMLLSGLLAEIDEKVLKKILADMKKTTDVVYTAAKWNFKDMPWKPKVCSVFLGLFPADDNTEAQFLIGLWVAEGVVTDEKEGMEVLRELINRFFLAVEESVSQYGIVYYVKVHEGVRKFASDILDNTLGPFRLQQNGGKGKSGQEVSASPSPKETASTDKQKCVMENNNPPESSSSHGVEEIKEEDNNAPESSSSHGLKEIKEKQEIEREYKNAPDSSSSHGMEEIKEEDNNAPESSSSHGEGEIKEEDNNAPESSSSHGVEEIKEEQEIKEEDNAPESFSSHGVEEIKEEQEIKEEENNAPESSSWHGVKEIKEEQEIEREDKNAPESSSSHGMEEIKQEQEIKREDNNQGKIEDNDQAEAASSCADDNGVAGAVKYESPGSNEDNDQVVVDHKEDRDQVDQKEDGDPAKAISVVASNDNNGVDEGVKVDSACKKQDNDQGKGVSPSVDDKGGKTPTRRWASFSKDNQVKFLSTEAECPEKLSSLSLSRIQILFAKVPSKFLENAKKLRTLDLSGTGIRTLPRCVGELKFLTLLNISGTRIRGVPECVKKLKLMQYLRINSGTMPIWINELTKLRHVSAEYISFWDMTEKLHQLKDLHMVDRVWVNVPNKKGFLTWDKVFQMDIETAWFSFDNFDAVKPEKTKEQQTTPTPKRTFKCLYLKNRSTEKEKVYDLPDWGNQLCLTETLSLTRVRLGNWTTSLYGLKFLSLHDYKSKEYPEDLGLLINLKYLWLDKNNFCESLPDKYGHPNSFPRLKRLYISDFENLTNLPLMEEGAMLSLRHLKISNCPKMEASAVERLRNKLSSKLYEDCNLEKFEVENCDEGFEFEVTRIQREKYA